MEVIKGGMVTKTRELTLIPGQERILRDFKTPILAAVAGTGAGKTLTGYFWLHSRMEADPGLTWGVAEPNYPMLAKVITTSSDPERPDLLSFLRSIGHKPQYHAVDRIIETLFGQIYLGSADNPDSMQGAALKGYWLDEAGQMSLRAFETALQRVSMMQGQVLLTTTPYNLGWLLTEVVQRKGEGVHVEQWRSIDRPGYPRESYEYMRNHLPLWRFRMLFDAQFERPAGLIYSLFDERACVIPRCPIPPNWEIYVGHDFGAANPAALFYAMNPGTGQFRLFHEYLPGAGRSIYQHVEEFKRITQGHNVIRRVGGSHQEDEIRQGYSAHGWHIIESKNNKVEFQILQVQGMHKLNKIEVFSDLSHYLDEKRTFSRELDDNGQVTDKIEDEQRFHLMAAERYLLSDFLPETGHVVSAIRVSNH